MCTHTVCLLVCPLSSKAWPPYTWFPFWNPGQIDALVLVDRHSLNCHPYTVMRCKRGWAWAGRAPTCACNAVISPCSCFTCSEAVIATMPGWEICRTLCIWCMGIRCSRSGLLLTVIAAGSTFTFFEMTQIFMLFCFRVIPMTNIRMWWCRASKSGCDN